MVACRIFYASAIEQIGNIYYSLSMFCVRRVEMTPYRDLDRDSGVRAYDIGQSHIDVQFKGGAVYRYTSLSAGQANLEQMARLARAGDGLNAFISRVVGRRYSARIR